MRVFPRGAGRGERVSSAQTPTRQSVDSQLTVVLAVLHTPALDVLVLAHVDVGETSILRGELLLESDGIVGAGEESKRQRCERRDELQQGESKKAHVSMLTQR